MENATHLWTSKPRSSFGHFHQFFSCLDATPLLCHSLLGIGIIDSVGDMPNEAESVIVEEVPKSIGTLAIHMLTGVFR